MSDLITAAGAMQTAVLKVYHVVTGYAVLMAFVKQIELSCVCNHCFDSCEAGFVSLVHYVWTADSFLTKRIDGTDCYMQITSHALCYMDFLENFCHLLVPYGTSGLMISSRCNCIDVLEKKT